MSAPVIGSTFSGYGGLDQAVQAVLGGRVAWHVENAPAPSAVLAHRFPGVPNLGDVSAVDWQAVEPVDVLTTGFPCTDVSAAGKQLGLRPDTRSGLWTQAAYAVGQLRPSLVVIENVRGLLSAPATPAVDPATPYREMEPCPWCVGHSRAVTLRALGAVLGDLAGIGYDAVWRGVRASDVGAPHPRFRIFVLAWPSADARGEARRLGPGLRPSGSTALRWGRPDDRAAPDAAPDADRPGLPHGLQGREPLAGPRRIGAAQRRDSSPRGDFGTYGDAVARWELLTRPAPSPWEPGRDGKPRVAAPFVEWLMGLPAGWVTDPAIGLSRKEQITALGNGVVPQQAEAALRLLLGDRDRALASEAAA